MKVCTRYRRSNLTAILLASTIITCVVTLILAICCSLEMTLTEQHFSCFVKQQILQQPLMFYKSESKNWSKIFQRLVVNIPFSNWHPVTLGILQGLILGPMLFNSFVSDLYNRMECTLIKFSDDASWVGKWTLWKGVLGSVHFMLLCMKICIGWKRVMKFSKDQV